MKMFKVMSLMGMIVIGAGSQTVTDIEGNAYNVIAIGTQVWMKENLRATRYNDNTAIQNVADSMIWSVLSTAAYCDWGNAPESSAVYGVLYNWYVVDDPKGICPTGWHVPSDEEWSVLADYLGGDSIAGSHLKEKGNEHWVFQNFGADNSSGFTALPSGHRHIFGSFSTLGYFGFWWSSTGADSAKAWDRFVSYNDSAIGRSLVENINGFCIRCLRDLPTGAGGMSPIENHSSAPRIQQIRGDAFLLSEELHGCRISVFNYRGQTVHRMKPGYSQKVVNLGNLPKGSYLLDVVHSSGTIRRVFVIY